MTTTIRSVESDRRMTAELYKGHVVLTILTGDVIAVDRAHFLDAVRSELGVLIIDKADLPEVVRHGEQLHAGEGAARARFMWGDAASMRAYALSALALAEHIEAHPLVDEQQVEALARVLSKAWSDRIERGLTSIQSAREMAQQGTRVETVQS